MPRGIKGWTLEQRLLDKIIINEQTDCWEWQAAKNNIGYGMIKKSRQRGMVTAHRAMYELHNAPIPQGKVIMHTCSNYGCINPDHLVLATRQDVIDLMVSKDRHRSGLMRYKCCDHCGLFSSLGMIARWHDANCKKKPNA